LRAEQIDSWQEYTLLKIDNADVEPIYLLKMTCPSTGFIHALRVPPNVRSAREAIRWVNGGIDADLIYNNSQSFMKICRGSAPVIKETGFLSNLRAATKYFRKKTRFLGPHASVLLKLKNNF
jgi:hypothetical protein